MDLVFLFVVAVAMQAPWWTVSTAADYFLVVLIGYDAEFAFGLSYAISISLALLINLWGNGGHLWLGGFVGMVLELAGMAVVVCTEQIVSGYGVTAAYWAIVVAVGASNMGSAFLANSLYGIYAPQHKRGPLIIQV